MGDSVVEVPDAVLADLAGPVAAALPLVEACVPAAVAEDLGRLRAVADGDVWPSPYPADPSALIRLTTGDDPQSPSDVVGGLPPLLTERLLGALERIVPVLDLTGAPDLGALVGPPGPAGYLLAPSMLPVYPSWQDSEAAWSAGRAARAWPGAVATVVPLARRLVGHPVLAPLLTVDARIVDEAQLARLHGAAHLALAVVTATAVLRGAGLPAWLGEPPAVVGVGVGAAAVLLRSTPMPAGYTAALFAKARAGYRLPQVRQGRPVVSAHRFGLVEDSEVPEVEFGGNGLVAVVDGGVVVRTGIDHGPVAVGVLLLDRPPVEVEPHWDEIVEVSWHATTGLGSVRGPHHPDRRLHRVAPPWPGDYRVRVHARGRDALNHPAGELYQLTVWQAPTGPEIVHARTDRLGHRLRGQAEPPPRPDPPEAGYRWIRDGELGIGATITVVTGSSVADVVRAFGADPTRREPGQVAVDAEPGEYVMVLDVGAAVVAVECNGFEGTTHEVLTRVSAGGRAGGSYWNVNAVTQLSLAEHGTVLLAAREAHPVEPPQAPGVFDGLDFSDHHRGIPEMGMVAVERFTGYQVTEADLDHMFATDTAYPILTT